MLMLLKGMIQLLVWAMIFCMIWKIGLCALLLSLL